MRSGRMRLIVEVVLAQDTPKQRTATREHLRRAYQGILLTLPPNSGIKYEIEREVCLDGKTSSYEWRRY